MFKVYKIIFFSVLFALGFVPISARAATLSFSSTGGTYAIGQTFTVNVYVGSANQAMNAASGIVTFSPDKLQVLSVSKVGSIFSLWVQDPTFSNASGTVSFEGIVLNPGFTGNNGKIMSITFRTKNEGQANLGFTSGSVLANDGSGSNILSNSYSSLVTVGGPKPAPVTHIEEEEERAPDVTSGDSAPIVISTTHPDQAKWYANNTPEFSWNLPQGALEVRTLIGVSPTTIPTIRYTPPIGNKKTNALADGTYYFHLQIRTAQGWGEVAHYRVNIDRTPPEAFSVTFPDSVNRLDPRPKVTFKATDGLSGVDHYDIKIDQALPVEVTLATLATPYALPSQYPGLHTLVVTAVDGAGNRTNASSDFTVEALDSPTITTYPEEIVSGELIRILGTTYPNAEVTILIRNENSEVMGEELARSNSTGNFSLVTAKKLSPGVHTVTARVTDASGARSNETEPLTMIVEPKFLTRVTAFFVESLSMILISLLALALILGLGFFLWYRLIRVINALKRQNKEVENLLKKSFTALRTDIDKHIAKLKTTKTKRELTTEEIAFLERFEKDIIASEAVITKGLKSAPKKKVKITPPSSDR